MGTRRRACSRIPSSSTPRRCPWVWVRRYHLPEAELVNGRAAMVGYFLGYVVDALTGHGLVDQTSGFLGKTLIFATVLGVVIIRNTDDIKKFQGLRTRRPSTT